MENKYIKHILDDYLVNQYAQETEDKVSAWLIDEENAEEKNVALQAHWEQLQVNPDIFLYDSLAQVKERIEELSQPAVEMTPSVTATIQEESIREPEEESAVMVPVIQLSAEDVVESPTYEVINEKPEESTEVSVPVAIQQESTVAAEKSTPEITLQPIIQLKEEPTGPALTRPSASSWESEEVLTGMSFIEEEENKSFFAWWKIAAIVIPFIAILAGGYFYLNREPLPENWLTLTVPYGESKQIELPDGSVVWLNAGSSLDYPDQFTSGSRTVRLTGEGYFSVTKDLAKPFRVETSTLTVEVLGTEFNLMAYPDEQQTIATLASGKIQVETSSNEVYILQPHEQLAYNNQTAKAEVQTVESLEDIQWKEGELIFKDQSLQDIVRTLERKYDIRIHITDDLLEREESYTVKFVNKENIEQIMDVLKDLAGFTWKMDAGDISISSYS